MSTGKLQNSAQAASNISLGQVGSGHLAATESATGIPANSAIVAITMCEDTTFTTLTQEDAKFIGTGTSTYGNSLANTDTIAGGITIFGRWSAVTVNTGSCIFYLG
tara:strand:- start:1340 stop:1657 length:318 start_codon:yes stop_codon:yes gene_type:complete